MLGTLSNAVLHYTLYGISFRDLSTRRMCMFESLLQFPLSFLSGHPECYH